MTVTLKPKCYVFVCAGCDLLADSERSDAVTCSTACRVRAHRSGAIKRLRERIKPFHVPLSLELQARAIDRLTPQFMPQIIAGKLTFDDVRDDVWREYWRRVMLGAGASS